MVSTFLVCVVLAAGCSDPVCEDGDNDGFGPGCTRGADCDDEDPTRNVDCSGPPVDCAATPFVPGCPCLFGSRNECFDGPAEKAGVGQCSLGVQYCTQGRQWDRCVSAVLPAFETCNGLDDDCDGVSDNGVLSPCGGCDPSCVGGVWGEGDSPFETTGDEALALTERGELTLAYAESSSDTLWVTNTGDDTVSRIDTNGATEVARYDSGGSQPTRVAMDHLGDVWIANRAFEGQSVLTKIASSDERCVDRDGTGIDTSVGPTDVKPRGTDDCVIRSVRVGGPNAVARALAIDGFMGLDDRPGRVWVGLQNERRLLQLDAETGEELQSVSTPDFEPFDAAMDRWGVLWVIDRDGRLARVVDQGDRVDVRTFDVPQSCWQLDALAIDVEGRITLSGFYCDRVHLFDPRTERFQTVHDVVSSRGVAVDGSRSFTVLTQGELAVLSRDPFRLETIYPLSDGEFEARETVGVAVDGAGHVWAISTLGGLASGGLATRFDLSLGQITAQVPVGRLPYAAGDLTGLARAQLVAQEGVATHVFTGCTTGVPTRWQKLHAQWLPGAAARLSARVRHAASTTALTDAAFLDLGDLAEDGAPVDLSFPDGGAVEVELTLMAGSRLGAPRVARIGLQWDCGGLD